jgi:hypothetical protein
MYATLNTGAVNRSLTTADLNAPDGNDINSLPRWQQGTHLRTLAAQAIWLRTPKHSDPQASTGSLLRHSSQFSRPSAHRKT